MNEKRSCSSVMNLLAVIQQKHGKILTKRHLRQMNTFAYAISIPVHSCYYIMSVILRDPLYWVHHSLSRWNNVVWDINNICHVFLMAHPKYRSCYHAFAVQFEFNILRRTSQWFLYFFTQTGRGCYWGKKMLKWCILCTLGDRLASKQGEREPGVERVVW